MESFDDILKIKCKLEDANYSGTASIKWLKEDITELIKTIQLIGVTFSEIKTEEVVEGLKKSRKEIDSYNSLEKCFNLTIKESLIDLGNFLHLNSKHFKSL